MITTAPPGAPIYLLKVMDYKIYKNERGYWFMCGTLLAIHNGPFKTREEAKQAADLYVKNW